MEMEHQIADEIARRKIIDLEFKCEKNRNPWNMLDQDCSGAEGIERYRLRIISASLYERSAYVTGLSPGPSVRPHM